MRQSFAIFLGMILGISTPVFSQLCNGFSNNNTVSTIGLKYAQTGAVTGFPTGLGDLTGDFVQTGKKKAILASLILPGTGERMLDADARGTFFTATEAVLWLGLLGFSVYSDWREQDYQSYAKHHASVDARGKDGQYWINIAGYDNIHEYNTVKLQNRSPEDVYPITEKYSWDWESFDARYKYDTMRIESRVVSQYATFMVGAIVFNHLASALDATYLYNSRLEATENSVAYRIGVPLP